MGQGICSVEFEYFSYILIHTFCKQFDFIPGETKIGVFFPSFSLREETQKINRLVVMNWS